MLQIAVEFVPRVAWCFAKLRFPEVPEGSRRFPKVPVSVYMPTLAVKVKTMIGEKQKTDEEIRHFVECHPIPSPDDEEGDKFCKKVIDRLKTTEGVNGMIRSSSVRQDLTEKNVMIDCGKEPDRDGEFNAMIINLTLLPMAMDKLNDAGSPA